MAKVLVVDDEITMIQMISELLRAEGHEVFPCSNARKAIDLLEEHSPELVIADLYLEKSRPVGLDILDKAKALNPPAIVLVITGYATVSTAVEAMKKGAFDYLEKPFKLDDFKLTVERALAFNDAVSENLFLKKQLNHKYQLSQIVGRSASMQEVFKMVERVADTDSTILILGESGTGKELVARALHFNSRRQFAPFVPVNCAALPENLLESELFGHRKGAFTGAIQDKKGLFQEADGGTIFLDEIGSMSPVLQSRLLRVLQDREVRRVGDNTPIYVNVRVLAATNEPLLKKVQDGTFREDLYYRLNVIAVELPPLRERRDDIPLVVAHFLKNKPHPRSGQPLQMSRQAMQAILAHAWPGNVRELQNAIERASALCETEVIQLSDLPPRVAQNFQSKELEPMVEPAVPVAPPTVPPVRDDTIFPLPNQPAPSVAGAGASLPQLSLGNLKDFMREQEAAFLNRALAQTNGDKEKAAALLGISLATLYRKLSADGEG
ncbi:MAG: sigma-54-dependent Fis family transcriptional regulator [Verrucomicrobia bacterium]|nr:sigma-54-dependent Fis family transcriptional regulator [Verrucomicrobiota bacterium]